MFFSQGCWAKLEDGNRLVISDECRLVIKEVAFIQEGWKDKRLEFPRGCSFHAGDGEFRGGYLGTGVGEVRVADRSSGTAWTLSFDADSRHVVLTRASGGGLACVNCALASEDEIEAFVKVRIREREQLMSNRLELAFLVMPAGEEAREKQADAGGIR